MPQSDLCTNAALRQILARHLVDMSSLRFGSFRGTVRFNGRLVHTSGRRFAASELTIVEVIERETKRISGVRAVHFDLSNWQRSASGEWREVAHSLTDDTISDEAFEVIHHEPPSAPGGAPSAG